MRFSFIVLALALLFSAPAEARHRHHQGTHHRHHLQRARVADSGSVIGGRPSGCPYQFCGCGASLYLFHRIIPDLNLAWNWAREFPRAMSPAPRMAAVRSHHVMVLLEQKHDSVWLVYDANSGRHQTRIHERSIAGYIIVDPSGGLQARRDGPLLRYAHHSRASRARHHIHRT